MKPTPLIPQEVYLLERYSSLDYFGTMRDAFEACVRAAEGALAEFMKQLPPDYRNQPLFKQPDRTWGETVIPNLQWALRGLNEGFIVLSHGDADALGMAGNVNTSFTAIQRDYDCEWMPEPYYSKYDNNEIIARELAFNISYTEQGNWKIGSLTTRYQAISRGPLDAPSSWPLYRLNSSVRVGPSEKVIQSGVYLPDAPNSCAQFLVAGYTPPEANVQPTPDELNEQGYFRQPTERHPATWTLIERVADSGGGTGCDPQGSAGEQKGRPNVPAGQPCPEAGWWFTPAKPNSRRHFKQGETMPSVGGDYGQTFWQWSPDQSAPKL
ncbi:MAG: hypothetical protein FHP92_19085 [Denitromonas halophila]|nr:MAG: hypothetical protein FHP92_19085 [Denitromonas halophila]